jgi:chemotaxis protein CheX
MNVKFLNPFVEAAYEVLQAEAGFQMRRGELGLEKESYVTNDVTVIISLVGNVEGSVFYGMSLQTALILASKMLGENFAEFNNLAQSGIAELGNVITGRASVKLSQAGYAANISPPTLVHGRGAVVSTPDIARLVVPLVGECGDVVINLALRESLSKPLRLPEIPVPERPSLR